LKNKILLTFPKGPFVDFSDIFTSAKQ